MNTTEFYNKWVAITVSDADREQLSRDLASLVHTVNTTAENIHTVVQINTIGGRTLMQVLGSYRNKDQADHLAASARKGVDNRALKKLDARIEIKVFSNRLNGNET